MPLRHLVGGYPDGTGSEEAHRPAATRGADARWLRFQRLASGRRFRLQAAGIAALALIFALAFLLPPHTVHVTVDGGTIDVSSRIAGDEAIVAQAGVALRPGDRVEQQGGNTIVVHRATEAVLEADGTTYTMRTQAETIGELLAEAGVTLGPDDSVLRNNEYVAVAAAVVPPPPLVATNAGEGTATLPASSGAVSLEVLRAVPFDVVEDGRNLAFRSSRETVATALHDVGVELGPGDLVQPPLGTELTAGVQVHVQHAAEIAVTLPEGKVTLYTLASTVGDALTESDAVLPADYRVEPATSTPIAAGLVIHVIGVSHELTLETERIESHTVYEPDASLPWGEQRVVAGQDGVHYRQFEVVSENGEVQSRDLAADWYDPEPSDTVVYYSTAPATSSASPSPSAAAWADLVCSYDWDCDWALAVIACESGGNPDAYNPQGYVGLFQIWEGHAANLQDPATNIAAAYSLYRSGGRGNWPNCP